MTAITASASLSSISASASFPNQTVVAGGSADVSADDTTPLTGQTVTFTPSWTGLTPTNWAIDFGDGNSKTATGASVTYKYLNPGTYTVKLFGAGTSGTPVATKTNYITASEDDLTSYGTINSWVNFQDTSMLTLSGSDITNINDNVTGVDWITNSQATEPILKTLYDDNGLYKFCRLNRANITNITESFAPTTTAEFFKMDDTGDQITINGAANGHLFLLIRHLPTALVNMQSFSSQASNTYFRMDSATSFRVRSSSTNIQQNLSGFNFKSGTFHLYEIQLDSGTLRLYIDGTLVHTQSSYSGNVIFDQFGSGSNQGFVGDVIGWAVYGSQLLSGASLTSVRDYFNNKKPTE